MYPKIHVQFVLSVIIKLTCSATVTIYHACEYNGFFEESTNEHYGEMVGGLSRVKHVIEGEGAKFIFTGNFIRKYDKMDRHRLKAELAVLSYLEPTAMILGNNEYSMSPSNLKWFLSESNFSIVSSNVKFNNGPRNLPEILTIDDDIQLISYNMPSIKNLKGAEDVTIEDPIFKLKSLAMKNQKKLTIAAGCAGVNEIEDLIISTQGIRIFLTGCSKSTFQWPDNIPLPPEGIADPTSTYPSVMTNYKGQKVLVAHAYGSTKFLGKLTIRSNGWGSLVSYKSEMLYLNQQVPLNPRADYLLEQLMEIDVGTSRVFLNGECDTSECNLGNLITDSFIQYKVDAFEQDDFWTDVSIALMPAGNIYASIDTLETGGYITMQQLLAVFKKKQDLITIKLQGAKLREAIELALTDDNQLGTEKFLQVSGLIIRYDAGKDPPDRLLIRARCAKCEIPAYAKLNSDDTYKIITTANLALGAFGHYGLGNASIVARKETITDLDAVIKYIRKLKIVRTSRSDRITIIISEKAISSVGQFPTNLHNTIGIMCAHFLLNKLH